MSWKQIKITKSQKDRFREVMEFVEQEPRFKDKRVKQSDAFELLLRLFETSLSAGMVPYE